MPSAVTRKGTAYNRLLRTIQKEITVGIEQVKAYAQRQTVKTYWTIGQKIDQFLSSGSQDERYGREVFARLAQDLSIHQKTLYQCVQFYQVYPRLNLTRPLTWSHYRYLSQLDTQKQRRQWEARIIRERLGVHEFLALLHDDAAAAPKHSRQTLSEPARGAIYHYRLIKLTNLLTKQAALYVDCGFENYIDPPPSKAALSNTRIYECRKSEEGYRLLVINKRREVLYTYAAALERIVDADTLLVRVDCGFGIFRKERLRLKGIDAPEKSTIAGMRAVQWIEKTLKECAQVVIQTNRSDKYDRYLADVFYLPGASDPHQILEQGTYLNKQMVEEGHAVVWK